MKMTESRLSRVLRNDGEEYKVNGETLILKSLTGKDSGLFGEDSKNDTELPFKMVYASLRESYDDISYDEVKAMPLVHLKEMARLVLKASGLDKEELDKEKVNK